MSSRLRVAIPTTIALLALIVALGAGNFAGAQGVNLGEDPPGTIVAYGGQTAPPGWLLADGSEVSRTQFPELFAAIGTTYGAGNASTTFNLPDLRGRVAVGRGTNLDVALLGMSDGLAVGSRKPQHKHGKGSIAIGPSGAHTHGVNDPGHSHRSSYEGPAHLLTDSSGVHWAFATAAAGPDVRIVDARTDTVTTGISIQSSTHTHTNADFTGFVGDTSGPAEAPAHLVINYIVKT